MNKLKQSKAITLIALIITIIVLLILAGVVINMTLGSDGIISKAQSATDLYKNTQEKEEIQIAKLENEIDNYVDGNRNVSEDRIREIVSEEILDVITDAIANANKEEALWTNPNPTSDFAAQTVSWTSTEYNRVYSL